MATLRERIETDYREALKAGQRRRVEMLRLVKAAIQREAIEQRKETLDDQEILKVLAQQTKQCRETMESAKQGKRDDVLAQATEELAILTSYLPEPLSEDRLKVLIEEALQSVGPHRGQIMKYVMGKAAGAADGKQVNQLVEVRLKST